MNNETRKSCFFLPATNVDKTEEVFITIIITCILNSVFSLLTTAGNFVILYSIRKTQNLHSPSFILLCCLAFSDLLVGAICQPLLVAKQITKLEDNLSAYCIFAMFSDISGYLTSGISFLTLAAVSIDRLLALTLHLRYNAIVTIPRVFQTTFALWISATACVMLKFFLSNGDWLFLAFVIFVLTLLVITLSTFKILQIVRKHQRHINDQNMAALNRQASTVNVLKCRKSAVTVLYVYCLFLLFYLPFSVTIFLGALTGRTRKLKIAYDFASTAVYINSFLNPLVYCWRIREIRRAVKNVLRRQMNEH